MRLRCAHIVRRGGRTVSRAWRMVTMMAALVAPAGLLRGRRRQRPPAGPDTAKEVHLANVKQLTFGGENAEA